MITVRTVASIGATTLAATGATTVARTLLCGLLLSLPVQGQQITSIEADEATLGDVVRVFGTDLGAKPKLVFALDGKPVKKTKLKVVGSGDDGGGPWVDVEVKNGVVGAFPLAVKQGKQLVGTSKDTLALVPPAIEMVDPGSGAPGDEVDVIVEHYGAFVHQATIAFKKAKITGEQDLGDGRVRVTLRIPKVPGGTWPVTIKNRLGLGILKSAVEVTGSTKPLGAPGASIVIDDGSGKTKTFKAKKKKIATDEQPGPETNVGAVAGSNKKPIVFGISLDSTIMDLEPGDSFGAADSLLLYSITLKGGEQCSWSSTANEPGETFAVDVAAKDDESMVLFVCGTLRKALGDGPETIEVVGTITAPLATGGDDPGNGTDCDPLTTATGSATGAFTSEAAKNTAHFGIAGPGTTKFASATVDGPGGAPLQTLSWTVSFNPATDATPVTFDGLAIPAGTGLSEFSLTLADATIWSHAFDPMTFASSMSVTITSVEDVPNNPFGILGCIHGTFAGSLTESGPAMTAQTFSGSFEIPWYDTGFGQ